MLTAKKIIDTYIKYFTKKNHRLIQNSSLVPENDPTTLFTSSGMQPLVPYLLGEKHPLGKRLVNVQNSFRGVDIDEVGDNRHTTFFRMLGNWSLGDYFKKEEIPWLLEFLNKELNLSLERLYVTVFKGYKDISKDNESSQLWQGLFEQRNIDPKGRIFYYGTDKNWWSRCGPPEKMPAGEPGGPSTEVFYDLGKEHDAKFGPSCHPNCDCGRYIEIANSVFMQYKKQENGLLKTLDKPNVDFGAGLERLLLATENQPDLFKTSLFLPIIASIEKQTDKPYGGNEKAMRIIADHMIAACFITAANIFPSNKDQGYILRRLIRRAYDHSSRFTNSDLSPVIETIVNQYKDTDSYLTDKFEHIKLVILEEIDRYALTLTKAKAYINKKYSAEKPQGDELMGTKEIAAEDAFYLYASHGLSPTQIKSLGYTFNEKKIADIMKAHKNLSKRGAEQKFRGGLADHKEKTVMGHTATHLLHQALRDILGNHVHQTGSNITADRIRFDFNYENKLTEEQVAKVEKLVNEKIAENLSVHFEILPIEKAKEKGAIGLFDAKYGKTVKVYFIGTYSIELCGGPHVDFTGRLKSFKIIREENIGNKQRRIYARVGY